MFDEEISKMKIGVTQAGRTNLEIREPNLVGSTPVLERAVTLLSWLRPHQWRSVPFIAEHDGITDTKAHERCSQPRLVGKLKSRTWGATT